MDGDIGHVTEFVVDDKTWAIRYLVVDTRNWWPGKHVLISPLWIERVSWDDRRVCVNLSSAAIRNAPEYSQDSLISPEYEAALSRYYSHYNAATDRRKDLTTASKRSGWSYGTP